MSTFIMPLIKSGNVKVKINTQLTPPLSLNLTELINEPIGAFPLFLKPSIKITGYGFPPKLIEPFGPPKFLFPFFLIGFLLFLFFIGYIGYKIGQC